MNDKQDVDGKIGEQVVPYHITLGIQQKNEKKNASYSKIWQIFPCFCACLMCLPFGFMIGWTSPSYPYLLKSTASIRISFSQSALVTGLLMIGNSVGTLFSTNAALSAKYGLLVGNIFMTAGWIVMWQARNIYWLLISRFIAGVGFGYGVGQLKRYIQEMCDDTIASQLIKLINLFIVFGILLVVSYAPFVSFNRQCIIAMILTVFILFLLLFIPSTPRELFYINKMKDARKLLMFLNPTVNVELELEKMEAEKSNYFNQKTEGVAFIWNTPLLRKQFIVMTVVVFCQQFSGMPATIVYAQILFEAAFCPHPEFLAIVYMITFFISNVLVIQILPKFNKKNILLCSTISVCLITVVIICLTYYNVNRLYWNYTTLIVMLVYIIVHTLGLGTVPLILVAEMFPRNNFCTNFFIILHSISALVITKIFQVLLDQFNLYAPFVLFLVISVICCVTVIAFVPKKQRL